MTVAAQMLFVYVSNSSTMHVDCAEAIMVQKAHFTVDEFDAAVDEVVAAGIITESENFLTVVR